MSEAGTGLGVHTAFCYYATAVIVFLGVYLGYSSLTGSHHHDHFQTPHRTDLEASFANWDGQWYVRIARDGYYYDPEKVSSVSFFPAFPLVGRYAALATGLDYDVALTLVSNVFFFFALVVFGRYVRHHPRGEPPGLAAYATLAMALFPVGFFFRMAYSDSLFLFLAILTLYGLARRWPFLLVAAIVGLATAARPVGLALIPPLLLAGWRRYSPPGRRLAVLATALPVCVWGLVAYVGFQYLQFGDPLAFAKSQANLRFRPETTRADHALALATLEPLWSVYDESSKAYWRRHDPELDAAFSLQFANPLYFAGTAILVGYGAWRRWLSAEDVLFTAGVLLIPYLTRGYEMCMGSHARYAAVAFPIYLVLGRLLTTLPPPCAAAALALAGFLLGAYSALFAGWYLFI